MKEATLYFDGGIRKGLMAYGWLVLDPKNETIVLSSGNKTCGLGTSNVAEYRALIAGLQGAIKLGINIVHIVGDSQLIIKQVLGIFKAKQPELRKHRDYVIETLKHFDDYTIKWVPRRENKRADALVNEVFERRKAKCSKQRHQQRQRI